MRPGSTLLETSAVPGATSGGGDAGPTERGDRPVQPLVDATWAIGHLDDPTVRFVEVDEHPGRRLHRIPGTVTWVWASDLCDPVQRDVAGPEQLAALLGRSGVGPDTHIILYGEPGNWFAAWAFWLLRQHGVERLSLLDGARTSWVHQGLPLTTDVTDHAATRYPLGRPSFAHRAMRSDVVDGLADPGVVLVDVRGPREYSGELIAPPGVPETAQRAGHIPGAISVPWDVAVNADGTFRDREQLRELYEGAGVVPSKDVTVYCRIGERSSHTWFVLHELLGYPRVRNYDGSWTEWGSAVGMPVER
jgi:thiosulfate/3-mercaptopyruvate sulfurtransferase